MSSNPRPHDRPDTRGETPRFVTGRLLAGRYEILDRVGEGGTAVVFRARDHRLDRAVAVKVLRPQFGQDPDARARFAVEARSAAALAVSNIVPVYDFGAADDGSLFIVMRFIDGPSLRRVLSERGALPPREAVDVGRQVAEALAAAHAHGLVHRDVKPGNILLDGSGRAHLTDFGTVKALSGADDLTRSGMIFGTAAYLAPEQATGGSIGPGTDVYALGVVLYEALTGRAPFTGDDPMAVSYRHAHEAATPLGILMPGIDPELARVVMQCLEKDPVRRPATADDLAATLGVIHARLESGAPAASALGALAAETGGAGPGDFQPRELEKETVLMATVPPVVATAVLSAPVAPAARHLRDAVPFSAATLAGSAAPAASAAPGTRIASGPLGAHPAGTQLGLAPPGRQTRVRPAGRRAGGVLGAEIVLLAILLALVGTALALPLLLPGRDDGGVADVPATPVATLTPRSTVAAIVPPVAPTDTPFAAPTPRMTATPDAAPTADALPPAAEPTATPEPTPEPTPERTRRPRPERTPERTPRPTPEPTPEPTPPPAAQEITVRIPDQSFEGDYDGPGSGRYHGRTASWVYGQGTPYNTMTARFRLDHEGQVGRRASLEIVGLDGDNPRKSQISIALNGATIYAGPNPLPNDDCCGPSGPGNWGSAVFDVPGEILRRNNSLVITNLEPGDCTQCPNYVMVDYADLEYRVRP